MSALPADESVPAAPIVAASAMHLAYGEPVSELPCLYVQVDGRSRSDVADFLSGWQPCCDTVSLDWRSVRRPAAALVGLELQQCCGDEASALRLVFDVRRDREALEALAQTETLVVGSRPYGGFANTMAAYGVDGGVLRSAMEAAERGLKQLVAVAS